MTHCLLQLTTWQDWSQILLDTLQSRTDSLSESQSIQLKELLSEYQYVFALNNSELSSTNLVQHHIGTRDFKSIHQHARRIPFSLHKKIENNNYYGTRYVGTGSYLTSL